MGEQSRPEGVSSGAVEEGGVRFEGDFRPEERAALAAQFSACRFRIVERSVAGRAALVEWERGGAAASREGPRPLYAAPTRALYVLELSGPASASSSDTSSPEVARAGGMADRAPVRLERIDSAADLAARYPGQFPTARVRTDWGDRLRRMLRDVWPALMLVVPTVWVLAFAWSCRA